MKNIGRQDRIRARKSGLLQVCQLIVLGMLLAVSLQIRASEGALVAAASSLRSLWPALVESYTTDTGQSAPRVSFGSSGLLATQIINGAPFELFMSADFANIDRLPSAALLVPPQRYALGELHLVVPIDSPMAKTLSLDTLAGRLRDDKGHQLRLAIANPRHAPYGQAAQQALTSAGIWPLDDNQLLAAENAAQTLQFVMSGAVDAAIIPQALVFAYGEGVVSIRLPADSYMLVEHTLAIFKSASVSAQGFAAWLLGSQAAGVFEGAGLRVVQNSQTK